MTGESKAMVLERPGRLEPTVLGLPPTRDDDGLLRIEACGLCGTDHEQFSGVLPGPGPFIPGHEIVGTVEVAGAAALERWGVKLGQRVAVEVFQSCRTCDECLAGAYRRCRRHGLADMYGFVAVDRAPGLWGGYAEYLYLSPDAMLLPVPAGLDPILATLFNPLGAGLRWAVEVPETTEGDVVVVLGPGIRGISCVVAAKEAGAGFVAVTGNGPRDRDRLATAAAFGADLVIDVADTDPVQALRSALGRRADVVVDVTAKAPAALGQAVDLARPGGTVVLAGTRGSTDTPGFVPDNLVYKELRVIGSLGVDAPSYRRALELLGSGRYPFESISRRVERLEAAGELLADLAGEGGPPPPPPLHAVVVPGGDF